MAGRHRARFRSIHIIKVAEKTASECIRANTKQFLKANIAFPLPHRVPRGASKGFNKGLKAKVPCTYQQMYQEMAGRHRARFRSIHIIKVAEKTASECIRANTKQYLKANIAFPLPHRVARAAKKGFNKG